MKTKACQMLGIERPIVLAPMGGAVGPDLAAAVCNAGGLGLLPLWSMDVAPLRQSIADTRALTDKPFGVNLNLDFPQEERLEACLEENVPIISFFWQDPGDLVRRAKDGGALVMYTVASAEEARRAVDLGVDIVVAQGWEAGGHVRGTVSTLALVPAVVDAVGDTPVIAAGGIADGRALAAVFALGAQAGWIGTRFLACPDATIHAEYQQALLNSSEADTGYFETLFDGHWAVAPHRTLLNSTVDTWETDGRKPSGSRPNEGEIIAWAPDGSEVRRYDAYTPRRGTTGDIEACSLWSGQGVAQVRKVQPAAEIVDEILAEARATLKDLHF